MLTNEQRDRVVELKFSRLPEATIAAEVGCGVDEVREAWVGYLRGAADATDGIDAATEAIARLERVAADARLGMVRARTAHDHVAVARYLDTEQRAILAAAKLQSQVGSTEGAGDTTGGGIVNEIAARRAARDAEATDSAPAGRRSQPRRRGGFG